MGSQLVARKQPGLALHWYLRANDGVRVGSLARTLLLNPLEADLSLLDSVVANISEVPAPSRLRSS